MAALADFLWRPGRLACFVSLALGLPLSVWLLPRPAESVVFWLLAGWGLWHGLRFVTKDLQKRNAAYKKVLEKYEPDA